MPGKTFLQFLSLVLLLGSAFASVNLGVEKITVQKGQWKRFTVIVENDYGTGGYFTFSFSGIPTFMRVFPSTFYLNPGQHIIIEVTAGGNAPGIYYYTFYLDKLEKNKPPVRLWEEPFILEILGPSEERKEQKEEVVLKAEQKEVIPGQSIAVSWKLLGITPPVKLIFSLETPEGVPAVTLEKDVTATEGRIELQIPQQLRPGNYTIEAVVQGKNVRAATTVNVAKIKRIDTYQKVTDYFIYKKVRIFAKNSGNVEGSAVVELPLSRLKSFFVRTAGDCSIEEKEDVKEIICYRELKPGEEVEIGEIVYDYTTLALAGVVAVLAVAIIFFKRERVIVEKKIEKIYEKDGRTLAKVVIRILNPTPEARVNVVLKDRVPGIAEVVDFKLAEPALREQKDGYEELTWIFSRIEPGEERIIAYEIALNFGIIGELSLPAPEVTEEPR